VALTTIWHEDFYKNCALPPQIPGKAATFFIFLYIFASLKIAEAVAVIVILVFSFRH
jgi:hypothetical protein